MPILTHRYPDRALLYVTHNCPVYCRHCTRQRKVGDVQSAPSADMFEAAYAYLERTPAVRDVLVSGGDPLSLADRKLVEIVARAVEIRDQADGLVPGPFVEPAGAPLALQARGLDADGARAAPVERIRVPTLVITGTEDRVYPAPIAQNMAGRIPGAKLAALEGCGHLSNLEQPERFNRVLMEFLDKENAS